MISPIRSMSGISPITACAHRQSDELTDAAGTRRAGWSSGSCSSWARAGYRRRCSTPRCGCVRICAPIWDVILSSDATTGASPVISTRALKMFPLVAEARGHEGLALRASRDDALAGLSVVVAELYNGSTNGTLDRLKMCAAEECRRVFYDRSKPATRRWCMSTLCGNRTKTRTYRARHRGAG